MCIVIHLYLTIEMADLCFSISSMSQFYSLICSYFVLVFSFIFSHHLHFSYLINIPLLLLHHIYHNFTPRLSEPGSTFLLLALFYDIFTTRLTEHGSNFVASTYYSDILGTQFTEESEAFENVFLLDEISSFDVVECSEFQEYEAVSEEIHNYLEHVHKVVEAEEEEPKLRTRQGVEGLNINNRGDDGNEYGKTSVTSCLKSRNNFVENNFITGGLYGSNLVKYRCTGHEEEWKSTLAWKLFEERHYNVVKGDEGMDWLWEAFEADSKMSRQIDVVVKKKDIKKKSGELDEDNNNEDDEEEEVEMRSGCLQGFKCCSAGVAKMNMRKGRTSIVKTTKPLKMINWWHHLKRHVKRK